MFSLIITIISIALVAALALATLYFGGSAMNKGTIEAQTAQLLGEAQQVEGALTLFRVEHGRGPYSLEELTANGAYLKAVPANWAGGPAYLATTGNNDMVSAESCLSFNMRRAGLNLVPSCDDPAYVNVVVCCETPPAFVTP